MSVFYKHPLPLPLGEVAERSEDGEGKPGCNALSVTFGDSSPGGRAKGVYHGTKNGAHLPCLSLWERWTSAARTERGDQVQSPLSRLRRQLSQRESQGGCTTARKMARISLASPFGRGGRARGRGGETRCKTLSVTFGDSSPKGRAKGCSFHFSSAGKLV